MLRQGHTTKLVKLVLNSLYVPGKLWNCDSLASAFQVAGIPGVPHQAWLNLKILMEIISIKILRENQKLSVETNMEFQHSGHWGRRIIWSKPARIHRMRLHGKIRRKQKNRIVCIALLCIIKPDLDFTWEIFAASLFQQPLLPLSRYEILLFLLGQIYHLVLVTDFNCFMLGKYFPAEDQHLRFNFIFHLFFCFVLVLRLKLRTLGLLSKCCPTKQHS